MSAPASGRRGDEAVLDPRGTRCSRHRRCAAGTRRQPGPVSSGRGFSGAEKTISLRFSACRAVTWSLESHDEHTERESGRFQQGLLQGPRYRRRLPPEEDAVACSSVHAWKPAWQRTRRSLVLHFPSLCCLGLRRSSLSPAQRYSSWERCSVLGGFLQSAVTTRSELTCAEHQLPLDNRLRCLCDQNSSAGNCGCEWQARCHPGGTAFLVRVMQLGDLVCVYLRVHPNTPQTQNRKNNRKRQNRDRRNLSLEIPTNADRWIEVNACCRVRMLKYTALKTSLWARQPVGSDRSPTAPSRATPCAGLGLERGLGQGGQRQQGRAGRRRHQLRTWAGVGNLNSERLGVEKPHVGQPAPGPQRSLSSLPA
ncbi:uncharacterized protein LOC134524674 [Chroicocephalus ridibundus]|uniref:uncharacterized protein LOC134524674 n=1 Tax=Chroicocephalus ridibundus TaxID=1192867 RepID=UPI002FDEF2FA